jgi:hypothetical protein
VRVTVKTSVPAAMQVLLSKVFGASSAEARISERSNLEWRRTLRKVNQEVLRYLDENVHTDPVHESFLQGFLSLAEEVVALEDFWPAYAAAFIGMALSLMGDHPDHRGRRGNGKRADHYMLRRHRAVTYSRDADQAYRSLYAANALRTIEFDVRRAFFAYRARIGNRATHKGFMRWFREKHPDLYSRVF